MIRRWAHRTRQQVRSFTRRALDRLDPPPVPRTPPPSPAPATEAPPAPPSPLQIEVEQTPNPLAIRFALSRPVAHAGDDGELGRALAAVPGVASLFWGADFLTVTRADDSDDAVVREGVLAALRSHG
jgi:hypothetical protein